MLKLWRVVARTGRHPYQWMNRRTGQFVQIDILHPDTGNRAYSVDVWDGNPHLPRTQVIHHLGRGSARNPTESWAGAFASATRLAKQYMEA